MVQELIIEDPSTYAYQMATKQVQDFNEKKNNVYSHGHATEPVRNSNQNNNQHTNSNAKRE